MTTSTALRIARYAEGVYAAIAIVLALGVPLPPRGTGIVLFAHWIGTSLLALGVLVVGLILNAVPIGGRRRRVF